MTNTTLPALDGDDGVTTLEEVVLEPLLYGKLDTGLDILLPDHALLGGVNKGEATTGEMSLTGDMGMTGDGDDGDGGPVLGDEPSRVTCGGEDDDGTGLVIDGSVDGGGSNGLGVLGGSGLEGTGLVEEGRVAEDGLGEGAYVVHHGDGLNGVGALGGLTGEHDTVSSVEDGVGDIGDLGTGGPRIVGHGLEHLGGADNGLTSQVALGNHGLLGNEDTLAGDFNTQVTTGDHDTIGLGEDLGEVGNTLKVLNLRDDLNVLSLLAQDATDLTDILTPTDEGGEDHVNTLLHTKAQVILVLFTESGEIDIGAGEVDTLTGGKFTGIKGTDMDGLVIDDTKDLEA